MRLSASSEVEGVHLVGCPHCGALNGRTATLCWKCDSELATPNLLEPAPVPQPAAKASGGWWPGPRPAAAESPQPSPPPPPEAPPPAAPAPVAADTPASTPKEVPASAIPPEDEAGAPTAIWAFAESTSFADHAETLRRHSRRVVSTAMVAVAAALAVAAYFLFRPAAVGDASWHVTAPANAPLGAGPAAPTPVAAAPKTVDANPPSPPLAEPATAAVSPVQAPPIKPEAGRSVAEPPPATARPRPGRRSTADEEPPPHPGPCTPQIAALGLCKLEPKP